MIRCAKCKQGTTVAKSIQLRKSDRAKKGVCVPCYDRLTEYRKKRAEKAELLAILLDIDGYKKDWEAKQQ